MKEAAAQLYLIVDVTRPQAKAKLARACDTVTIASVLLTAPAVSALGTADLMPFILSTQGLGVAVLIDSDANLAKAVRADGVHVRGGEAEVTAARRMMGPHSIVGLLVDPASGAIRHDAMTGSEAGADYVAFPPMLPPPPDFSLDAADPGHDVSRAQDVFIAWWADVFILPCVAWGIETPAQAQALAACGAEFIALTPDAWMVGEDVAATIQAYAACLAGPRPMVEDAS